MTAANVRHGTRQIDKMEDAGSNLVEPDFITSTPVYITDGKAGPWRWLNLRKPVFNLAWAPQRRRDIPVVVLMLLATYALASACSMAFSRAIVSRQVQTASPFVTLKNGSYAGLYSPEYEQDHFLGMPYSKVGLVVACRGSQV
jgi:hypothetical protein